MTTALRPRPKGAWTDRVLAWLEGLPWPLWTTLLAGAVLGLLLVHATEWVVGGLPFGHFDAYRATFPVYPFGLLGLIAILKRVSLQALERFRPASGLEDAAYRRAVWQLTHQPPSVTLVLTVVFGALGLAIEVTRDGAVARMAEFPVAFGVDVVFSFFGYMLAGPYLVAVFRLLRRVAELHRDAPRVDLLNPEPVRAFSSATAVVGVSLASIMVFSMVTDPETLENAGSLLLYAIVGGLAFASFIVPLWGMHRRLLGERTRMLSDAGGRLEATLARLYAHVDEDRPGVSDVRDRLSALVAVRDLVAQQSTWPWRPETLRWFLSALIVPIIVWSVTRFLERVVGPGS